MRKLRSLETAGPEWEGHERAEALIRSSDVRVDHVAGDRACYNLKGDRVVLPERSQFASVEACTDTALHELGHATGHPGRLNRPTLVDHGGFGTETCAREELRAEIPRVAAAPFPLVIEGESGTGKELVARAIHEEGLAAGRSSCPSTARCSATSCSSRSCSGTPGTPSPARRRTARGCWSCHSAAPSSSTRWPS